MKAALAIALLAAFHLVNLMDSHAASPTLVGSSWIVTDLAGTAPLTDAPMTFAFDAEGNISGNASCNRFGGRSLIEGDRITISRVRATRRYGPQDQMEQEQRFLVLLQAAQSWALTAEDNLILTGPEGSIQAKRQPAKE
ncbi:MAG: META domain-containing protein [Chthoniobacterales bacterium]